MRVAELGRLTGVPVPTIKYYLREGLLPPGVLTSPNQARYGEEHVRRVKMIRAMVDIGGLSITATKEVLAAIDCPDAATALGTMAAGMAVPASDRSQEAWQAALKRITQLIRSLGWKANVNAPAGQALVAAVAALHELGRDDLIDLLEPYAAACADLAKIDMATVSRRHDNPSLVEGLVIDTVIGDVVLSAIRRLAHQDVAAQLFADRQTT